MSFSTIEKIFLRSTKVLLLAIPFLSLLVTQSMFFPFITGRNFGFRIIVEIAVALWIGLMLLNKKYRPKLSIVATAILIFIFILVIADTTGIFPYKAFWSNYERMEGLITFIHLGLYFFLLTSVFKSKKDWLKVLNSFVIAGALVAIYGFFQKFGFVSVFQPGFRIRPPSTIGNPSYLAAYLILIATLAFYLFFERESVSAKYKKILGYGYLIIGVLSLLMIYITGTRGAFLGFLAGLLLFSALYLFLTRGGKEQSLILRRLSLTIILIAIIVPSTLFLSRDTEAVKSSPLLSRYASISFKEGFSRFRIWSIAVEGFKERPILGYGQEGFLYVFSKHYNPELLDQEPWFDRTHNIIFDWLISAGILGLLAYLFLIFSFVYSSIKSWGRKIISTPGFLVLIGGLSAYFIQNLFVFDNLNTYLPFFVLLAFAHGINRSQTDEDDGGNLNFGLPKLIIASVAIVAVGTAMYSLNAKPIKQSLSLIDSISSAETRFPDGSLALLQDENLAGSVFEKFKKTFSFNSFGEVESLEQTGQVSISLLGGGRQLNQSHLGIIALAIEGIEDYLKETPDDARMRLFLANLYNRAIPFNAEFADHGLRHLTQLLELNSTRQLVYFVLGENYLARGDFVNAVEAAKKAVNLAPEFETAQATLGQFAVLARDNELAQEVINRNSESELVLVRIAEAYLGLGDLERAAVLFNGLAQRFPGNPNYLARLAEIYIGLGQFDNAIAVAEFLAQNNPDLYGQRSIDFIKRVEEERSK